MQRIVHVIFDGEVLRPEEPLDLQPNARYHVIIESSSETPEQGTGMLDDILELAVDFGIPDLAAQFEHYMYGAPKQ
ncbi:MAG: antitoxin family protein [Dehalococcoidia bacterium]